MIVAMRADATAYEVDLARRDLRAHGLDSYQCRLGGRVVLSVPGARPELVEEVLSVYALGWTADPVGVPPLASAEATAGATRVRLGPAAEFGEDFIVMAGPCAVESEGQLATIAEAVAVHGAAVLRGGAFKPRTSPYSFQGLGGQGLNLLSEVRRTVGLPVVTEVAEPAEVGVVAATADMLQIGTRNAQNFALLREVGRAGRPVLLKRGLANTVDEWLNAAEYILREGNPAVVLCERGIRTFEPRTRFTLDLSAVPLVKRLSHLPVVVDPSHATGDRGLVEPMALAAVAAGADGVLVDVHHDASAALCDGLQALKPAEFRALVRRLRCLLAGLGRGLAGRPDVLPSMASPAAWVPEQVPL